MITERRVGAAGWRMLGIACGVALLAGCGSYRLGTALPPGIRTVHVPQFVNKTKEPQVEIECTRAALREFQKDGTLRIASADTADAVVSVTVTGYSLDAILYEKDNSRRAREYRLTLTAKLVFRQASTGKELLKSTVTGDATVLLTGSMASAKAEALPKAAESLAHSVVETVVEFW